MKRIAVLLAFVVACGPGELGTNLSALKERAPQGVAENTAGVGNVTCTGQTPTGLLPTDLASAYNIIPGGGSGITVAVVDSFHNPNALPDLNVYRDAGGLPPLNRAGGPTFYQYNQSGQQGSYPGLDDTTTLEFAREISEDLDMVSATCPACNIILVEADGNDGTIPLPEDSLAAVSEAVALGASVISISWNWPESGKGVGSSTGYDPYFEHPGILFVAAAGDTPGVVNYPAASPYVLAVGGTTLKRDSSTSRGWTETAWNSSTVGCSVYEPKMSWQTDTGCPNRTVADVAAVADWTNSPVAIYNTYDAGCQTCCNGWANVGGTSAATPIVAGIFAATFQQNGVASYQYPSSYPYLNNNAGKFYDVTSGADGTGVCSAPYLCNAVVGYDAPTGVGTPNASALAGVVPPPAQLQAMWVAGPYPAEGNQCSISYESGADQATCIGNGTVTVTAGSGSEVVLDGITIQPTSATTGSVLGMSQRAMSAELVIPAIPKYHLPGSVTVCPGTFTYGGGSATVSRSFSSGPGWTVSSSILYGSWKGTGYPAACVGDTTPVSAWFLID